MTAKNRFSCLHKNSPLFTSGEHESVHVIKRAHPSAPPPINHSTQLSSPPGRVAQSVGHLTRKSGSWVRYPVWQHTFVSPSAFSRRAVVSYWRKYEHEVLVNRLGGLSLPRKRVVRLTDRPDMTLDVYRGRKTTMQQKLSSPSQHLTAQSAMSSINAYQNRCNNV